MSIFFLAHGPRAVTYGGGGGGGFGASTLFWYYFRRLLYVVPRSRHGQINSKMLRAFKFSVNKWECLMMGTSKLSSEPVLTDFEREITVESDVIRIKF